VGSEFQTTKINLSFNRLAGEISLYYKLVTDSPTYEHKRGIGARSVTGIKASREFS